MVAMARSSTWSRAVAVGERRVLSPFPAAAAVPLATSLVSADAGANGASNEPRHAAIAVRTYRLPVAKAAAAALEIEYDSYGDESDLPGNASQLRKQPRKVAERA